MGSEIINPAKISISALKEGELIDGLLVVKIKKGMGQYAKGYNFKLLLSDYTGRTAEYVYWGDQDEAQVKTLYDGIAPDAIVHVKAKVGAYMGKLQLTTNAPMTIHALPAEQGAEHDFILPARKDIDIMYAELKAYVNSIHDEKLRRFMLDLLDDADFKEKFRTHPAAISIHHNWRGGLLQHTIEILGYCQQTWEMHQEELDRDLLIIGAILHDSGKIFEMETTTRIKGTTDGMLLGHITQAVMYISTRLDKTGIPAETKTKILHLILSHHGRLEYGSPKEPMLPEAVVLYYCDELSSKASEVLENYARWRLETEDDFMYDNRSKRNFYLK